MLIVFARSGRKRSRTAINSEAWQGEEGSVAACQVEVDMVALVTRIHQAMVPTVAGYTGTAAVSEANNLRSQIHRPERISMRSMMSTTKALLLLQQFAHLHHPLQHQQVENRRSKNPPKKEPEKDMLSFDDGDIPPITPPKEFAYNGKKPVSNPMDDLGALAAAAPPASGNK